MDTGYPISFDVPATKEQVDAAVAALADRGIRAEVLESGAQAMARIREIIPSGASISTGASLSLKEIGLEDLLKSGAHPWKNLKAEYLAETDPVRQMLLRRQSTLAEYFLGSVQAVAQTGEVVIASMTGSQLASYAYGARNLLWVVGIQKIVPSLDLAIRRVREHVLPHENERMKAVSGGKRGSRIGKLMIFEFESPLASRTVTLLFVRQKLGD